MSVVPWGDGLVYHSEAAASRDESNRAQTPQGPRAGEYHMRLLADAVLVKAMLSSRRTGAAI